MEVGAVEYVQMLSECLAVPRCRRPSRRQKAAPGAYSDAGSSARELSVLKDAALANEGYRKHSRRKGSRRCASFKAWLQAVAQKAAEAGTEGGFLGFGGVDVSDAQKATLGEISAALKA